MASSALTCCVKNYQLRINTTFGIIDNISLLYLRDSTLSLVIDSKQRFMQYNRKSYMLGCFIWFYQWLLKRSDSLSNVIISPAFFISCDSQVNFNLILSIMLKLQPITVTWLILFMINRLMYYLLVSGIWIENLHLFPVFLFGLMFQ